VRTKCPRDNGKNIFDLCMQRENDFGNKTTITTVGDGKHKSLFLCYSLSTRRDEKTNRFHCRFVFNSQVVNVFASFHVSISANEFDHGLESEKKVLNVIFKIMEPRVTLSSISETLVEEHDAFPIIFNVLKITKGVWPLRVVLSTVHCVGGQTSWVPSVQHIAKYAKQTIITPSVVIPRIGHFLALEVLRFFGDGYPFRDV
jgi:hypothetical protein